MARTRKIWTPQEDALMREHFPNMKTEDVCKLLGRTYSSVAARASYLKIEKSPEQQERMQQLYKENLLKVGVAYRYQKGRTPENKNKKMSPELYAKVKPTMFPKGNKPHNTRQAGDFSDRMDKQGIVYRYVKIADANWQLLHRVTWEQHNGPIPPGYRIHFKDGDTLNCAIENLELLSPQQAIDRNRINTLPPELQEVKKLNTQLKRKLRSYGKK